MADRTEIGLAAIDQQNWEYLKRTYEKAAAKKTWRGIGDAIISHVSTRHRSVSVGGIPRASYQDSAMSLLYARTVSSFYNNDEYSKMDEFRMNEHLDLVWMNGEFMYDCLFECA